MYEYMSFTLSIIYSELNACFEIGENKFPELQGRNMLNRERHLRTSKKFHTITWVICESKDHVGALSDMSNDPF